MANSEGNSGGSPSKPLPGILKSAFVWAFAVFAGTIPLYFALMNDRDLQRTELGTSDQHTAYTDVLNAADALLLPEYYLWTRPPVDPSSLTLEKRLELGKEFSELFPEYPQQSQALGEATTRLRLVIQAEDARLITALADSLTSTNTLDSPSSQETLLTPADRLNEYRAAKLSLVNEFREDVLGEDRLPESEGEKLHVQTESELQLQISLRRFTQALESQQASSPPSQ